MKRTTPCQLCGSWEADMYYRLPEGVYVKCFNCALVGVDPLPAPDFIQDRSAMWSELHHTRQEKINQHYSSQFQSVVFNNHLKSLRKYYMNGRLLDVGCGIGGFVDAAKKDGWDSYGIDISPSVRIAADKGLNVRQCSLSELDVPGSYFDVITLFDVIEHIASLDSLMKNISHFLRPGGGLLVITPNLKSLSARLLGEKWVALEPEDHITLFSMHSLGELLQKYHFKVGRVLTHDFDILGIMYFCSPRLSVAGRQKRQSRLRHLIQRLVKSPSMLMLRNGVNATLNLTKLGERLIVEAKLSDSS